MTAASFRPGPLLPVADRYAARRPGPHGPVQLGVRPPHRRQASSSASRTPMRRATARSATADPRRAGAGWASTGTRARGRRPARPVPAVAAARHLPRRDRDARAGRPRLRVVLRRRGDRGAAPRGRPRPEAGLRQLRPRPHRGAARGVPRRGPAAGAAAARAGHRPLLRRPGARRDHLPGRVVPDFVVVRANGIPLYTLSTRSTTR